MKPINVFACVFASICLAAATLGFAPSGGGYDLTWNTNDGGGGTSSGGGFTLTGTIGQHDAGVMSGGSFSLEGGFWAGIGDVTPPCPADLSNSGAVDGLDIGVLLAAWSIPPGSPGCGGSLPCPADLNNDGFVDGLDIGILLGHWGRCP